MAYVLFPESMLLYNCKQRRLFFIQEDYILFQGITKLDNYPSPDIHIKVFIIAIVLLLSKNSTTGNGLVWTVWVAFFVANVDIDL